MLMQWRSLTHLILRPSSQVRAATTRYTSYLRSLSVSAASRCGTTLRPLRGVSKNSRSVPIEWPVLFYSSRHLSYLFFLSLYWNCQIFVDDVLVFRGSLLRSPTAHEIQSKSPMEDHTYARFDENQLPWGDADQLDLSQSIIFSNNEIIVEREVGLTFSFRLLVICSQDYH